MSSTELKLSVSKVGCYDQCKKKYKFAYVHKLPRKDFEFHIFGKFCHKVLENFHKLVIDGDNEAPNSVMNKAFKSALTEYKDRLTPTMKKDSWDIINQYLKIINTNKKHYLSVNVIDCEKKFEFNIDNKIILNGYIDRVQIDDDNVLHVADYKTSKDNKKMKNNWFQLATYCYILFNENADVNEIRASYIMLRHNFEFITKVFYRKDMNDIKQQYLDYYDKINAETEYKATPSGLCSYCDYLENCDEGKKKANPSMVFGEVSW